MGVAIGIGTRVPGGKILASDVNAIALAAAHAPYIINVKEEPFLAKGDAVYNTGTDTFDGTDDTAAINAAADALQALSPQHGGILYLPPSAGTYRMTGPLNIDGSASVTIMGAGGAADGGLASFPPSLLAYVGGGSGEFIRVRNSGSFRILDLGILYTGNFTGTLVDASNQGGSDTQFFTIMRSMLSGIDTSSAHALVSLWNAIFAWIEFSHFAGAYAGIRGAEEVGGSTGYSNVVYIGKNSFLGIENAVMNTRESWTIDTNGFEGLTRNNVYMKAALSSDWNNQNGLSANFINNWMGDAFGDQVWVRGNRGGISGSFIGNKVSGGYGFIDGNPHGFALVGGGPAVVMGNNISCNKVTNDAFAGTSLALYTYINGSGTLSESGGVLVPSDTTRKTLYRTALNSWDRADQRNTLKFTPDATLTGASARTAVIPKRIDNSNWIAVEIDHTANPPSVRVRKNDAGVESTLGSPVVSSTALVNGTPQYVRGQIVDDTVIGEIFLVDPNSDPSPVNIPIATVTVTLTGGDATKYGTNAGSPVKGKHGIDVVPASTGWTYDDHRMEGKNFSVDMGSSLGGIKGLVFAGNSVDNGNFPPVVAGGSLDSGLASRGFSMFSNTANSNKLRWWLSGGIDIPEQRVNRNVTDPFPVEHSAQVIYVQSSGGPVNNIFGGHPGQVVTFYGDGTSKTFKHGTGNLLLAGAQDMVMQADDHLTLQKNDTGIWREVSRYYMKRPEGLIFSVSSIGDTNFTYTVGAANSPRVLIYRTTLTANRNLTLSTSGMREGDWMIVARSAGGAFNLDVGTGIKTLTTGQWGIFMVENSAWKIIAFGSL